MDKHRCCKCKQFLPVSEFHKCKNEKSGLQTWCKSCRKGWKHEERKEYFKKRYHENRESYLDNTYKRFYGISLEEYNQILQEQDGGCAICGIKECATGRRLAVDHNHETGQVRGIPCSACNQSLGKFKEDINILKSAISYLEKYS